MARTPKTPSSSSKKQKQSKKSSASASGGDARFGSLRFNIAVLCFVIVMYIGSKYAYGPLLESGSLLPRHAAKPYTSFKDFFPFYLSEHSDQTCRRLHVIGTTLVTLVLAMYPMTIAAMAVAGFTGFQLTQWLSFMGTGIVEGACLITLYLYLSRRWNGTHVPALTTLILGYSFAWAGHFFFEGNRPATFIYPSYSLAGDFQMWGLVLMRRLDF